MNLLKHLLFLVKILTEISKQMHGMIPSFSFVFDFIAFYLILTVYGLRLSAKRYGVRAKNQGVLSLSLSLIVSPSLPLYQVTRIFF